MKRGEIYFVSLDPTEGREQRGHRPVLVVSPNDFNRATKLPIICPVTNGGEFAKHIGFAVQLQGTKTTGIVRCDQPRVLDLAVRNARFVENVPEEILEEVLALTGTIFE